MKKDLAELHLSINETARVARANLLFILVVGVYLAILVANTDDMLLLKAGAINLPLMQAGIPVVTFYTVAPWLYLLLNLNLYIRLARLIKITKLTRDQIDPLSSERRRFHSALVYPFDFLQLMLHEDSGQILRIILYIAVVTTIAILPLLLFIWIQVRFLAYQDQWITLSHQIIVTIFCIVLYVFWTNVTRAVNNSQGKFFSNFYQNIYRSVSVCTTAVVFALIFIFSWCIAVVPESWVERQIGWKTASACLFNDWWQRKDCPIWQGALLGDSRRHLSLVGKTISHRDLSDEVISAYILVQGSEENAWKQVDKLDLSRRIFRYGWFNFSRFQRVQFHRTVFEGARFLYGEFNDVDLSFAELDGINLDKAKLNDVILLFANLNGASLNGTELNGVEIFSAEMNGAQLEDAKLKGVDITSTELNGAFLNGAQLMGVRLDYSELTGSELNSAEFTFSYVTNVPKPQDPYEWENVEKKIRKGLLKYVDYLEEGNDRTSLQSINERRNKQHKLSHPVQQIESDRCVWRDDTAAFFENWSQPSENCGEMLSKMICRQESMSVINGIVNIHSEVHTGIVADNVMKLLNVSLDDCPKLSSDHRRLLCAGIKHWMGEADVVQGPNTRLEEEVGNKIARAHQLKQVCSL